MLPVRHGEGKFICDNQDTLEEISSNKLSCLRYCDESGRPTMKYPLNPNGSRDGIAGICDITGRIFGLMPPPEAFPTIESPVLDTKDVIKLQGRRPGHL
jgi:phosphoribosylformylglycinamidine synthase